MKASQIAMPSVARAAVTTALVDVTENAQVDVRASAPQPAMAMPPPAVRMIGDPRGAPMSAGMRLRPTVARAQTDRAPTGPEMTGHAVMHRVPPALAAQALVSASSTTIARARMRREVTTAAPQRPTPPATSNAAGRFKADGMAAMSAMSKTSALPPVTPNRPNRAKTMAACACPSS